MRSDKKFTKKTLRTVLSAVLLLALLSSMLLFSGCGSSNAQVDAPDTDGGSCGNGVEYEFNGTLSRLTIKGAGDMTDYASASDVPWAEYAPAIKKLVISESITGIGDYAFYYCTALEDVNIEATALTSVGKYAFWMNTALTEIEIPETVTEIGESAFAYCSALTSVSTASLTTLGASAFAGCTALEVVSLDGTLAEIPARAFMNCAALTTVAYPDTVANVDDDAFLNANEDAVKTVVKSEATLTVKYVDAEGRELAPMHTETLAKGAEYSVTTPVVDGYTIPAGKETVAGTMPGADVTVEVVYTSAAVDTEGEDGDDTAAETKPAGDDTEEKPKEKTPILALVLLVVIVIAIVVGAVLLLRSDKKITKDSQTVRKNDSAKNGKGKKK